MDGTRTIKGRARKRGASRKKLRRDAYSVLARAIARYLKPHGWNVVVVAGSRVESRGGTGRYRFSVDFLGGNPGLASASEPAERSEDANESTNDDGAARGA